MLKNTLPSNRTSNGPGTGTVPQTLSNCLFHRATGFSDIHKLLLQLLKSGWGCTEGILIVSTSLLPKQQALTWRPDQPIHYAIGSPHEASIIRGWTCNSDMTHSPTKSCEQQPSHHLESLFSTSWSFLSYGYSYVGQKCWYLLSLL